MNTDTDAVLIVLRVTEDSIGSVVPESTQGICMDCDHRIWISKSGQEFVTNNPTARFRCMDCMETIIRQNPNILQDLIKSVNLVPGALQEASEHFANLGPRRPHA